MHPSIDSIPSQQQELEAKVQAIINDLLNSDLKLSDAPGSSEAHFDRALVQLASLTPGWSPRNAEAADRLEQARIHMDFYRAEGGWAQPCPLAQTPSLYTERSS